MFIAALLKTANFESSLDAPQLMSGLRKFGIYTQCSFI
jgi:hypothetical protein